MPGLSLQAAMISWRLPKTSRLSTSNFPRYSCTSGSSNGLLMPGRTLFSWPDVGRIARPKTAKVRKRLGRARRSSGFIVGLPAHGGSRGRCMESCFRRCRQELQFSFSASAFLCVLCGEGVLRSPQRTQRNAEGKEKTWDPAELEISARSAAAADIMEAGRTPGGENMRSSDVRTKRTRRSGKSRKGAERTAFISAPAHTDTSVIRQLLEQHGVNAFALDEVDLPGAPLSMIVKEAID